MPRLIWVFAADAQADLSLRWTHNHIVGFVMRRLLNDEHYAFCTAFHAYESWTVAAVLNEPPHDKTNKVACAPSEDSDQPWHPPSLIRVFAVRMKKDLVLIEHTAKTLIRLGGCPGWSEFSLGAQSFCWFCHEAAHLKAVLWAAMLEPDLRTFSVYGKKWSKRSGHNNRFAMAWLRTSEIFHD